MSSGHGLYASSHDGDPGPSVLDDLEPCLRPPPAEQDLSSMEIASDEIPIANENSLLSRSRRQNIPASLSRSSSRVRPAYVEDLESQAVTSDDMSIDNENPLANRARRQNRPIVLSEATAQLRPSRAEELDDSVAVTSTSEEDMSIYENPYPLTARQRRQNIFHPIAPAAGLLPLRRHRQVYMRQDMRLALAPSPPSSRNSPPVSPTSRSVPDEFGYGYGYGGHDRSQFFLLEDLSNPRPVSDPTGRRPSRFVLFSPRVLTESELEELEMQNAALARYEESLDMFPGFDISSSDGEPSLSGSAFEESPVHDAITVDQAPIGRGDGDHFMGGNGHVSGL